MICSKCGCTIPDSSGFCPYCGQMTEAPGSPTEQGDVFINPNMDDIPVNNPQSPDTILIATPANPHSESPICPVCGNPTDPKTGKCPVCSKKAPSPSKQKNVIIALILVAAILAGLNAFQYIDARNAAAESATTISGLTQQVSDRDDTIAELKSNIEARNSTIETLRATVTELKVTAGYYEDICSLLGNSDVGYSSNNFKASESVIVVKKSDTGHEFTLTANWSQGGTVYVNYSSSCAKVSFNDNTWYYYTTLTVRPQYVGATVVTFSSSVNSKTFCVLIIVTD